MSTDQDFALARQLFDIILAQGPVWYGPHAADLIWALEQESLIWREVFGDITKPQLQRMAEWIVKYNINPDNLPPLEIRKD